MGTLIQTRKVAQGYEWTIAEGVPNSRTKNSLGGTEDKIMGGWAPTEAKAREKAMEAL